jgi:hypothetical protein
LGYFLQKDGWNAKTEKKEAVGQKKVKNRERGIGHIWGKNPEVTLRTTELAKMENGLWCPDDQVNFSTVPIIQSKGSGYFFIHWSFPAALPHLCFFVEACCALSPDSFSFCCFHFIYLHFC